LNSEETAWKTATWKFRTRMNYYIEKDLGYNNNADWIELALRQSSGVGFMLLELNFWVLMPPHNISRTGITNPFWVMGN
jgi:hypothetical protein